MKYFATSLLLLFISFSSNGQKVAISEDKMNIAYLGVPNPLTIVAENYPCNELKVTTDNGKIEKIKDCSYSFMPEKVGMSIISVFNKEKQLVWTANYRIKLIPNPEIKIGNSFGGKVNKYNLLNALGIVAVLRNFDLHGRYIVTHYKVELIQNNQNSFSKEIDGPMFNEEIKDAFKDLKSGDQMLISNIIVKAPGGNLINLGIVEFNIIE